MDNFGFNATADASTFAKRPAGYKLNNNPVLSCENVECDELPPTVDEMRGGIVSIVRVIIGRAVVVTAERADGVVNSVPWRFHRAERHQIEAATDKARQKCCEWLYRRSLLGIEPAKGGGR